MCILSYVPADTAISNAIADDLWTGGLHNPDGHGWAIAGMDGVMYTGHSLQLDDALAGLVAARERVDGDALFHSRWATHGSVRLGTCHPFTVLGDTETVLGHNGVLPARFHPLPSDGDISDTMVLAARGMRQFRRLDRPTVRRALSAAIGSNKLVILTVSERYRRNAYVINEHLGQWCDGVWHSNGDYCRPVRHDYGYTATSAAYEYVPVLGGSSVPLACELCGGAVNVPTAVCTVCGTCCDCLEHEQSCLCWQSYTAALDSAEW